MATGIELIAAKMLGLDPEQMGATVVQLKERFEAYEKLQLTLLQNDHALIEGQKLLITAQLDMLNSQRRVEQMCVRVCKSMNINPFEGQDDDNGNRGDADAGAGSGDLGNGSPAG